MLTDNVIKKVNTRVTAYGSFELTIPKRKLFFENEVTKTL